MNALHAIVRGRVQGVSFRARVFDIAKKLSIRGTVQNLSDGSVEIYAEATKIVLEQFLDELNKLPPPIKVSYIEQSFNSAHSSYKEFKILY